MCLKFKGWNNTYLSYKLIRAFIENKFSTVKKIILRHSFMKEIFDKNI